MMKRIAFFILFALGCISVNAQNLTPKIVEGDPYKVHYYTLENGLTVALTVNKSAPQIQTMIAVRTGSRNDPADNTGLAHYLEHMLFKGTENFGTKSYAGEKFYLTRIESFYKLYGESKDSAQRAKLYGFIDSFSYLASQVAIANEYDRMMQSLGATGTNAFTSTDQTVYINNIPTNQLEKWLKIEYDRFNSPVFRLFHTELEAVYEEKNRGLDNDNIKAYEALLNGLFPVHPYGTQTTIGTVEHLKNPSLEAIKKYYNTYYNPVNMALIMSGDFDPDKVIALVNKYLGAWKNKPETKSKNEFVIPDSLELVAFQPYDQVTKVIGPQQEKVYMAFRAKGAGSDDDVLLYMTDMILANSQAGMLDINLNKAQKVQYASCSPLTMKEYSMHYFIAIPKEGQTLDECKALVLEELEKLKRGEFDVSIMQAIVDNMRLDRAKAFDDNRSRASNIMEAFTNDYDWKRYVTMPDRLEKLTKEDVMAFAKRIYVPERRTTVLKLQGKDSTIQKIPKPKITPIETNREAQSHFVRKLNELQVEPIQAVFPNFNEAIKTTTYGKGKKAVEFSYVNNAQTDYFSLSIRFDMGTNNQPWLEHLADYMPYIATSTKTNEQISREFFNLACEYGLSVGNESSVIYLRGLNKNFDKAYALLMEMFSQAQVDEQKWQNLVADVLKSRADAKTNKGVILQQALASYARYGGNKNPFTYRVSEKKLKGAKAKDIQKMLNGLLRCKYNIWYFGPAGQEVTAQKITNLLQPAKKLKNHPKAKKFKPVKHKKNTIYFVPYDMVQAEVIWQRPINNFEVDDFTAARVFSEYFGTGMYSLVFQTIRESKALAYSSFAYINAPADKGKPAFAIAYVGTQADKLTSAMKGMQHLMDSIPNDRFMGNDAGESVRKKIAVQRITPRDMLQEQRSAKRLGIEQPVDQIIYNGLGQINHEALKAMQQRAFANKNFAICIIGSKERVDLEALKAFGEVKELTLEDVFGY